MKFEWNNEKERRNIKKHGIDFEQAAYIFTDPFALSIYEDTHADEEDRWLLLGMSLHEIILVVVHTFRNEKDDRTEYVCIISARKASKKEQRIYQQRSKHER